MKIVSFAIPCYNSEGYMSKCIESLLPGGEDVEIIIVDDGSCDRTAEIADAYAEKYPTIIKAIHQENGGHGCAVNTGLANASGIYFKVVDSDDWVDVDAYMRVLETLKKFVADDTLVDMLLTNYVYEKIEGDYHHQRTMFYTLLFPQERIMGWHDMKHNIKGFSEATPSTMAAVLALPDEKVEEICASIEGEVVVCANYNCPGQLVISGSVPGIDAACEKMLAAGAKRALKLKVGGAFHSPLMEPARAELAAAIEATPIHKPSCPVYQNVSTKGETCPETIKANLIAQLTAPVRWTQSVQNMIADGADHFIELGPGAVLQGLVKKINKEVTTEGMQ